MEPIFAKLPAFSEIICLLRAVNATSKNSEERGGSRIINVGSSENCRWSPGAICYVCLGVSEVLLIHSKVTTTSRVDILLGGGHPKCTTINFIRQRVKKLVRNPLTKANFVKPGQ